jgi:hypothetical protein
MRVLTEYPLKKVLQKPDLSGRLMNWAVKLGQFDIEFHPWTAVKGQVLGDFLVDLAASQKLKNFLKQQPG